MYFVTGVFHQELKQLPSTYGAQAAAVPAHVVVSKVFLAAVAHMLIKQLLLHRVIVIYYALAGTETVVQEHVEDAEAIRAMLQEIVYQTFVQKVVMAVRAVVSLTGVSAAQDVLKVIGLWITVPNVLHIMVQTAEHVVTQDLHTVIAAVILTTAGGSKVFHIRVEL